jgi:hypothetical protein
MKLATKRRRNQLVNHCWLPNKVNVQAGIYRRTEIISKYNNKRELI